MQAGVGKPLPRICELCCTLACPYKEPTAMTTRVEVVGSSSYIVPQVGKLRPKAGQSLPHYTGAEAEPARNSNLLTFQGITQQENPEGPHALRFSLRPGQARDVALISFFHTPEVFLGANTPASQWQGPAETLSTRQLSEVTQH